MVIEDRILSCEDKIRILELELDLKDYYDIKRPTVVFFNNVEIKKISAPQLGGAIYRFSGH